MALNTNIELRNALIYSVYLRNHSAEGTFRALEADLPRIRALGTDIIWLMPIHPIGIEGKKGSLGCPYANRDYRAVNPEYGTLDDFIQLVNAIHARGMKCMIDVVYNHTSPDSVLRFDHPEYFHRNADGKFGNRLGDWSDVIDLNYSVPELWDYQIESLRYWARIVDGFRCDVASLVPLGFWERARKACEQVKPNLIWLAETVHQSFNFYARTQHFHPFSDNEGYGAFDMEYDYDIRELMDDYLDGKRPLHEWTDALNRQETIYPYNYIKLRCLENHDQPRFASRIPNLLALLNWHAFLFFQKGATLLYSGEERCDTHRPSLFDRDPVDWSGHDISPQLSRYAELKKRFPADGWFHACADDGQHSVLAQMTDGKSGLVGLFSLRGTPAHMQTGLPDGHYSDLLTGETVSIGHGELVTKGEPVWIHVGPPI